MNFKEFLEEKELELFQEEMLEESLLTPVKFAAGAAGNLVGQTARSVLNLGTGTVQGAVGAGQTGLGALQYMGGGSKRGRESLGKGVSNVLSGGNKIARGIAQGTGALSGITPVLRGAQAASEPLKSLVSPNKGRSPAQELLGFNSWDQPAEEPTKEDPKPTRAAAKSPKRTRKPDSSSPESPQYWDRVKEMMHGEKTPIQQPEYWKRLVSAFKAASTKAERDEVARKMKLANPTLFMQAVNRSEARRKRQAAAE